MSQEKAYFGEVTLTRGGLSFKNLGAMIKALCAMFLKKGQESVVLMFELSAQDRRTYEQNRRLWAIYREIASYTGNTVEEIHRYLTAMLAPEPVTICDPKTGEIVDERPVGRSTRQMSKAEFAEYMTMVEAWAVDFGITFKGDE